jgi:hypothetical protein
VSSWRPWRGRASSGGRHKGLNWWCVCWQLLQRLVPSHQGALATQSLSGAPALEPHEFRLDSVRKVRAINFIRVSPQGQLVMPRGEPVVLAPAISGAGQ